MQTYDWNGKLENLKRLSAYLRQPVECLSAAFDMSRFVRSQNDPASASDCGSGGCAVGHGPYAGIPKATYEDWTQYCNRCFAAWGSPAGSFMFSSAWGSVDNTAKGAAKRIDIVVAANGWLPANAARYCLRCDTPFKPSICRRCRETVESELPRKLRVAEKREAMAAIVAFVSAKHNFLSYYCRRYYNELTVAGKALVEAQDRLDFLYVHPSNAEPGLDKNDPRIAEVQ